MPAAPTDGGALDGTDLMDQQLATAQLAKALERSPGANKVRGRDIPDGAVLP